MNGFSVGEFPLLGLGFVWLMVLYRSKPSPASLGVFVGHQASALLALPQCIFV